MGSTSFYPEEAPEHTCDGRSVRHRAAPRDERPVRRVRRRDRSRHGGRASARSRAVPGGCGRGPRPGGLVFRRPPGPVDLRDWQLWWNWVLGACWRHPFGPDGGPGTSWATGGPSGGAARLHRRGRLRALGGAAPAERGGMGVRGPGGHDHDLPVGRRRGARGPADGQHLARPVSVPQRRGARLGRHLAGRLVSAERVRPGRHDRQRVGVDDDAVLRASPARPNEASTGPRAAAHRAEGRAKRHGKCDGHA